MRFNTIAFVLAAGCSAVGSVGALAAPFFSIPKEYEALNRPASELVLTKPFPKIDGKTIKTTGYRLDDGWRDEQCSADDRNGGPNCGKPVELQPGSHILHIVYCTAPKCSIVGTAWNAELRFTVGRRERVTIDLTQLAASTTPAADQASIKRQSLTKAEPSACVAAVENALYVDTCRAAGFAELRAKVDVMHKTCAASWSKDTDLLHELVMWEVAFLTPQRCYLPDELKKLPRFLTEWRVDDGFWPPGTLKNESSWSWARWSDDGDLFSKFAGETFRAKLSARLAMWQARQEVVDQLIAAVIAPKTGLDAIIAASRKAPFDMNPSTPAGHRNFGLSILAANVPHVEKDARVSQILARGSSGKGGGKEHAKLHCAYVPEVRNLVDAFTDDGMLSNEEWTAIEGFLRRTPDDGSLRACLDAGRDNLKSPVPIERRLAAIGAVDCKAGRDAKVRGKTIKFLLNPEQNAHKAPEAVRRKLETQFAACLKAKS